MNPARPADDHPAVFPHAGVYSNALVDLTDPALDPQPGAYRLPRQADAGGHAAEDSPLIRDFGDLADYVTAHGYWPAMVRRLRALLTRPRRR